MKITALQEVLQSCLELSLRTGLIELPAPARLVDMCEQHRQKIQMTARKCQVFLGNSFDCR